MNTATFRDLSLGQAQGTLVESPLSGYLDSKGQYQRAWLANFLTYAVFLLAAYCFCYCGVQLYCATRDYKNLENEEAKESLIGQQEGDKEKDEFEDTSDTTDSSYQPML